MRAIACATESACSVGEDQVTRFRGLHRGVNAVLVANFADENDVGILAHGIANSSGERVGINADFTLLELRLVIIENVFDGIFDGDDPHGGAFVDLLNQGPEGGAFPLPCRPGDEDQTAWFRNEVGEGSRKIQFLQFLALLRHDAEGKGLGTFLFTEVGAITLETMIEAEVFLEAVFD